jgi:hypothetical protein
VGARPESAAAGEQARDHLGRDRRRLGAAEALRILEDDCDRDRRMIGRSETDESQVRPVSMHGRRGLAGNL